MKISPLKEWVAIIIILALCTVFMIYIDNKPIIQKLTGWTTPDSGIVFKNEGYISISNGQIYDIGGTKIRIKLERVDGEVAQ